MPLIIGFFLFPGIFTVLLVFILCYTAWGLFFGFLDWLVKLAQKKLKKKPTLIDHQGWDRHK